jgi:anti-sigma B factor antagonist
VLVVRAPEELDVQTAPDFRDELGIVLSIGEGATIVVDMSDTTFIDSSGMGALVAVAKLAGERRGAVALRGVRPAVLSALRLASLVEVLDASVEPAR